MHHRVWCQLRGTFPEHRRSKSFSLTFVHFLFCWLPMNLTFPFRSPPLVPVLGVKDVVHQLPACFHQVKGERKKPFSWSYHLIQALQNPIQKVLPSPWIIEILWSWRLPERQTLSLSCFQVLCLFTSVWSLFYIVQQCFTYLSASIFCRKSGSGFWWPESVSKLSETWLSFKNSLLLVNWKRLPLKTFLLRM